MVLGSRSTGPTLVSTPAKRLTSWKEIASYLGTSVRTVQRWERREILPVHRHEHASAVTVYAWRNELDAWLAGRGQPEIPRADTVRPRNSGRWETAGRPKQKRLIVLPFRLLRADPELDYLGVGLADAITALLSGIENLVVESTFGAARYANETDLRRIARQEDVDLILTGTVLKSGDKLRVSTQLVSAANGAVVHSQTLQDTLTDIFQWQDRTVARIVDALAHHPGGPL
jgi:TolB-like protein